MDGLGGTALRDGAIGAADLIDRTFRFSPAYRFVPFEHLTELERHRFGVVTVDPEMAGVLIPSAPGLSVKAVCADTARLLESLRTPASLPQEARATFARDGSTLLRLLLDTVLELRTADGFTSGPAIGMMLDLPEVSATTRPARLSLEAIRYAAALPCGHAPTLSARLYFYNRLPASPRWTRRIGSADDALRFLGLAVGDDARASLDRNWDALAPAADNPEWISWRARGRPHTHSPYKLYVSPACDDMRAALRVVVPILTEVGVPAFKLGRGLHGILRPDKVVVYASSARMVQSLADALLARLRGARAHGVPFTAAIDPDGLVSWGMDPPRTERLSTWQGTSWRRWVTDRLAVALLAAKGEPEAERRTAWRFALRRLSVEGVDTATWSPMDIEWMRVAR